MTINVITNNVPRFTIDAWDLSESEREEFDYIDWPAIERGEDSATFVRYRGVTYDLGEFMSTHTSGLGGARAFAETYGLTAWDGYMPDSFFSAILVRFVDDESVVMGLALS